MERETWVCIEEVLEVVLGEEEDEEIIWENVAVLHHQGMIMVNLHMVLSLPLILTMVVNQPVNMVHPPVPRQENTALRVVVVNMAVKIPMLAVIGTEHHHVTLWLENHCLESNHQQGNLHQENHMVNPEGILVTRMQQPQPGIPMPPLLPGTHTVPQQRNVLVTVTMQRHHVKTPMRPGLLLLRDQLMMSQDVMHQEILMRDLVQPRGEVMAKTMQRLMEIQPVLVAQQLVTHTADPQHQREITMGVEHQHHNMKDMVHVIPTGMHVVVVPNA